MRALLLRLRQLIVSNKALRGALFSPAACFATALLLASSAFAQTGTQANNAGQSSAAAPAEKSIISGKVVYQGNGRPVRRANMMLLSASDPQAAEKYSTATDSSGKFRFRNVAA